MRLVREDLMVIRGGMEEFGVLIHFPMVIHEGKCASRDVVSRKMPNPICHIVFQY